MVISGVFGDHMCYGGRNNLSCWSKQLRDSKYSEVGTGGRRFEASCWRSSGKRILYTMAVQVTQATTSGEL